MEYLQAVGLRTRDKWLQFWSDLEPAPWNFCTLFHAANKYVHANDQT